MLMDQNAQDSAQADKIAKVIASIIMAGIIGMFAYGIFGWIVFG